MAELNEAVKYLFDRNEYFQNGVLIRIQWHSGMVQWFDENGNLHNLNGPAFIALSGSQKYYYIHGVNYSEEEFKFQSFMHKAITQQNG